MSSLVSFFLLFSSLLNHTASLPLVKRDPLAQGPVMDVNFPDPALIQVEGTCYAFSTTSGGLNVPIATSPDYTTWAPSNEDALPNLPVWTTGSIWAPDVIQLSDGSFVLYFAGRSAQDTSKHCVGVATSTSVTGPYDALDDPLACPLEQGGAIDPAAFFDEPSSTLWVVYKIDGNALGGGGQCGNGDLSHPTPIILQQLSVDGTTPIGPATQILDRSSADGPLVEAPSLARSSDGTYALFFSSNCFNGKLYDVSYATATSVTGPYSKAQAPLAPLLESGDEGGELNSPGGADISADASKLIFHSDAKPGDPGLRQMVRDWLSAPFRLSSLAGMLTG
ncbi:MAG: hypothetical protein Q9190_001930 [Brigantiaea leucoxantha]